ncbi:hypothetical protein SAMN05444008_1228 [Cnuella takakiae]|uniref:Uncharacterized protein n=1 Tax=Cnuella takakiae TaxID=1302690 RepID=A0A1M5I5Y4_9BACT|nr:hypothetical protein [Cnuella takakiae]SHG23592.1 hypothetical protein SAMN05444008_1228 [Cnuella takakiae]
MDDKRKPDNKRANISFLFIVLLGYLIGFAIKRVQLGLILGLVLGILASGLLARRR